MVASRTRRVSAAAAARGLVILIRHPIDDREAVERAVVGALRPVDQKISAHVGRRRRKADPYLHLNVTPSEEMISSCR
jgi:hypothetical protein